MPVKMGDNSYEFECSRAELLGIPAPSYDEYLKKIAENGATREIEENVEQAEEIENLEEPEKEEDANKGVGRKLVEINNVIHSTQEKLHRFKASYGSFANSLKSRLGKSLDISFSQSESSTSQIDDDTQPSNTNRDNNQESMIGAIPYDNDKKAQTNQSRQNGQAVDEMSVNKGDEAAYKEIELNEKSDGDVKSPEVKKFLNFSFLNLGGGK